ncbi:30S ribosomal protein S12 methylthiotransferase RimO [Candidatus Albibeggiatoa sp. nov. NOAA]|uniref:30S ribosomal protein S12 methylthiotransferase RimO n=1 Tax=Candidatus Albibeggiatoa sp. nov. NOAA TaxID=3162724 RepID=UPI0032F9D7C5|nr:30S ribosomal protein S12 methylthiotransferase RimO [Thiotrichaceae bacterium]
MNIPKVGFISLGCPKATVDSERILTQLRAEGYQIVPEYDEAQLVVVNTCGFIDEAVAESLETIQEAIEENGHVIVTGCLGAKQELIKQHCPKVLAITGPDSLDEVMAAVHKVLPPEHDPHVDLVPLGGIKLTPRHYAYIKIAEGCNQKCSFCIIPSMRGKLNSRPIGDVLEESSKLVQAGVRELLLVSQDTAAYGVDSKYQLEFWQGKPLKRRLTELLREMGQLDAWIRLHYVYPYPHVDQLVELMAEGLVLPYLDVPLQHISHPVLKNMRRPADSENVMQRIAHWRSICPDLVIRSTFIVGFPGETEDDFQQLLDFLDQTELDRVGVFPYSPVEGATANDLPNPVEEEEKIERLEQLMALQADVSRDKLQKRIGRQEKVLIDAVTEDVIVARSAAEAPEIDGQIFVQNPAPHALKTGDFTEIKIIDADEHDLYAELV